MNQELVGGGEEPTIPEVKPAMRATNDEWHQQTWEWLGGSVALVYREEELESEKGERKQRGRENMKGTEELKVSGWEREK